MKLDARKGRLALNALVSLCLLLLVWRLAGDAAQLRRAIGSISAQSLGLSAAAYLAGLSLGALRWGLLLRAYGGRIAPGRVVRHYAEGFAFNMLVPGAIVGDVVRSVATRDAFPRASSTTAMAVTFVERILGLVGLVLVASLSLLASPLAARALSAPTAALVSVAAVLGALAMLAAIALLPRLARRPRLATRMPARARDLIDALPKLDSGPGLAAAFALSFATHVCGALASWCLLRDLSPAVSPVDAVCAFSIANAAAFFPLTLGGLGAREGAAVAMLHLFGVATAHAVAASLAAWCVQVVLALLFLVPRALR